ncbi:MAG: benzodiazapine receptor [Cryomorphaceae bacterium]|jgi:benzodiazapine receptor
MRTAYTYNIIKRATFIFAVFVLILVNALSNIIPFGGQTNAAISAKYPTLITPEGYAFSIWGIIYLTLAIFAVFQFFKGKEVRFYKMIWPYFMINVAANCLWLVAFQNDWLILSLALMAVILISLVAIFKIFYRLKRAIGTTQRYFFHLPFGLYFGWVSLAAVVNAAVVLTSFDLPFFANNEGLFALIAIAVATSLGLIMLVSQKDFIFTFAILWGLVAIYVKQVDEPMAMNAAKFGAIALIAAMLVTFIGDRIKVAKYGRSA